MMKKNRAETISACRRMASLRSRLITAVTIFNMDADASTEPQFADRTGGNVDVLMGRHHGQTAALQMAGNNAGQPVDRSNVERHEGFVENPQWALFLDQPGQRDASLLPCER